LEEEPPEAWSPEKTAVFLCRKLNTDDKSALKEHILVAAQNDAAIEAAASSQKKPWAVSTATVVEGLLRLFSSNPKRDRDFMHKYEIGKGRERALLSNEFPNDKTPLRKYYLETNDLIVFTLVRNYFNAVNHLLWERDNESFIRKTIGVQALFDVLRSLCVEAVEKKNLSESYFASRLKPTEQIIFNDNFFQASGTGRQRIRNSLELALGLKDLKSIDVEFHETYRRLCKL